jgi:hypothetical protein
LSKSLPLSKWKRYCSKVFYLLFYSTIFYLFILLSANYAFAQFKDVRQSDWFYSYLNRLTTDNIISGFPDGTFRPTKYVTRAELAAMIVRTLNLKPQGNNPFHDVSSKSWYYDAVRTTYTTGIIKGISRNSFSPQKGTTREQAAAVFDRAGAIPSNMSKSEIAGWLQGFADRAFISSWARSYVAAAVKYQLISGYANKTFGPKDTLNRAQAAALIYRLKYEQHRPLSSYPAIVTPLGAGNIKIVAYNYDAPGNDHYNLNGEWVRIKNTGSYAVPIDKFVLSDAAGHSFLFPYLTIGPRVSVTIYTGSGTNTSTKLYWGSGRAIWNNDGDTIYLKDCTGRLIHKVSYQKVTSPKTTRFVGNKRSKKLHNLAHGACQNYVNMMNEENKVFFDSKEEAIKAGYYPCKKC